MRDHPKGVFTNKENLDIFHHTLQPRIPLPKVTTDQPYSPLNDRDTRKERNRTFNKTP